MWLIHFLPLPVPVNHLSLAWQTLLSSSRPYLLSLNVNEHQLFKIKFSAMFGVTGVVSHDAVSKPGRCVTPNPLLEVLSVQTTFL